MRQVGFLAAAGSYALDHHVLRLSDDHANAKAFAEVLAKSPLFHIDVSNVQTNIVIAHTSIDGPDAATLVSRAREAGVLIFAFGPRAIRATTYLGIDRAACIEAGEILINVAEQEARRTA